MAIFSGTLPQCTQGELTRVLIIKTLLSIKCSYVNRSLCTVLKTGGWQFQKFTFTPDLPTIFCHIYIYIYILLDRDKVYTIPILYKCLQSCQLLSDSAEWHDKILYFDYLRHLNESHFQNPNTRKASLRSVTKFRCARFGETNAYKRDRKKHLNCK